MNAIKGAHKKTADFFINKIPLDKRDYNYFEEMAAKFGQHSLVFHYLNQLPEMDRKYLDVAIAAAENHHEIILKDVYRIIPKDMCDGRYKQEEFACVAAYRGCRSATDFFIKEIPLKERRYGFIACYAVEGKHQSLAEHLIDHENHTVK